MFRIARPARRRLSVATRIRRAVTRAVVLSLVVVGVFAVTPRVVDAAEDVARTAATVTRYETRDAKHGRCVVKINTTTGRAKVGCRDGFRKYLRPCPEEDSRTCVWDAGNTGNGVGDSFVDLYGRTDYLRRF